MIHAITIKLISIVPGRKQKNKLSHLNTEQILGKCSVNYLPAKLSSPKFEYFFTPNTMDIIFWDGWDYVFDSKLCLYRIDAEKSSECILSLFYGFNSRTLNYFEITIGFV